MIEPENANRKLEKELSKIRRKLSKLEAKNLKIREQLKEAEELYRVLIDTFPDAVTMSDLKGRLTRVSKKTIELHRLKSGKDWIGKSAFELIAPADHEKAMRNLIMTLKDGSVKNIQYTLRRMDGSEFEGELHTAVIRDKDGNPKSFLATTRDITGHKKAENALKESEKKYRILVENSLQGVVIIQDFRIVYSNEAFSQISGYSVDKLLSLTPDEVKSLVYLEDQSVVWARLSDRLAGKKVANRYEFRGVTKQGAVRWLEMFANPVQYNNKIAILGAIIDVTERKKMEETLRENEERYRQLIESQNDGIYLLFNRKFEIINKKFGDMFQFSIEDLNHPDFDFIQLVAPKSRFLVEDRVKKSVLGIELEPKYEFTALSKDGREIDVEASVSYIKYKDSIAVLGIVRDISERKKLEKQLLQAQKLEGIGRLAGGIAHDFNNLLTSMIGYVGLINMKLRTDDSCRDYVKQTLKAADRATMLIQQLLAFSRKAISKPRVISINQVIQSFSKMLRRVLGEDIEFEFSPAMNIDNVEADPVQIEQIIMNFAVNARDAMPRGGKLIIETRNCLLGEDHIHRHPDVKKGSYVLLMVSDTGMGMDEDTLSKIFDPFFTTKTNGVGTGLGLSMVYGITKQSGGHIDVYSEINKGSTFKIYLPRVVEPVEKIDSSPSLEVFPRGDETIVVVEDDNTVREMILDILSQSGYTVHVAPSGKQALSLWKKHGGSVHLLITDVVMPGMSGQELAKKLWESNSGLKVLYMSGYSMSMVSQNNKLDAKSFFIQKPFNATELTIKIRKILDS